MSDQASMNCYFIETSSGFQVNTQLDSGSYNAPSITQTEIKNLASSWENLVLSRINENSSKYGKIPNAKDVELGTYLFRLLLVDENMKYFQSLVHGSKGKVVISIITDSDEISDLPWEACAHANWSDLGLRIPKPSIAVVRTSAISDLPFPISEPVKILVAGANPKGDTVANFRQELDIIKTRLRKSFPGKFSNRYSLEKLEKVDFIRLQKNVEIFDPHVLHLVGHGGKGLLEIEDRNGNSHLVDGSTLYQAVSAKNSSSLCVVIITACLTMKSDKRKQLSGLGRSLENIVPVIVGLGLPVSEKMVLTFVDNFYYYLSNSGSVLDAYIFARDQVRNERPDSPEWIAFTIYKNPPQREEVLFIDPLTAFVNRISEKIDETQDVLSDDQYNEEGWENILTVLKYIDQELVRSSRRSNLQLTTTQKSTVKKISKILVKIRAQANRISRLLEKKEEYPDFEFRFNLPEEASEATAALDDLAVEILNLKNRK